jgi:serine phosphatase RsbU (regulator of sigma subunit)
VTAVVGAAVGIAAVAVASDATRNASGDWHDVIKLPRGGAALAIGDAVGRGIGAEPLKRMLQAALRVLVTERIEPADLVTRMRETIAPLPDEIATLVYAEIAPDGDLTMMNAGHPPPLVIAGDGTVRHVGVEVTPPLGAPSPSRATPSRTRLEPDDTLVLYTDGVVESAHLDIATGLSRLHSVAAELAGAPLDLLCAQLIRLGFHGGEPVDDLTAVAVRFAATHN